MAWDIVLLGAVVVDGVLIVLSIRESVVRTKGQTPDCAQDHWDIVIVRRKEGTTFNMELRKERVSEIKSRVCLHPLPLNFHTPPSFPTIYSFSFSL